MRAPKWDTLRCEIGCSGHGIHESTFRRRSHACEIEFALPHDSDGGLHTMNRGVDGIKYRLLRLLQMFVVRKRKTFSGYEQRGCSSGKASSFAADQLERVGIHFLWHRTAAGGVGLRQTNESELARGEENHLLRPAAEVNAQKGKRLYELNGEVAIARGIDRIGSGGGESKFRRHRFSIQRQRCSRYRTRAKRTKIQPL